MKLASLSGARAQYYDRNATSLLMSYADAVSPALLTTRWTTTITAGKKAYVETSMVMQYRLTAATSVGEYSCDQVITSGATNSRPLYVVSNSNATYNQTAQFLVTYTLFASESLAFRTYDTSTGGIMYFQGNAKLTIFDA
jgi:hypothetical protein